MIASTAALKLALATLWRSGAGKVTILIAVLCFGLVCALVAMLLVAWDDADEARANLSDAHAAVGRLTTSVALFEAQVERCNRSIQEIKEQGEKRSKAAEDELQVLRARLAQSEPKRAADLTRITRKLPDPKTCAAAVAELRKELAR